jgi:hypothetical protein
MTLLSITKKLVKETGKNVFTESNGSVRDSIHSKSLLGRLIHKEAPEGEDSLFKSILSNAGNNLFDMRGPSNDSILGSFLGLKERKGNPTRPTLEPIISDNRQIESPNASTLSAQIREILSKFNILNKILKDQQDTLKERIRNQEDANREYALEHPSLERPKKGSDDELADAIGRISEKVDAIQLEESGGGLVSSLLGLLTGGILGKKAFSVLRGGTKFGKALSVLRGGSRLKKGFQAIRTASGIRYRNLTTGRFVKEADAIRKSGAIGRVVGGLGDSIKGLTGKLIGGSEFGRVAVEGTEVASALSKPSILGRTSAIAGKATKTLVEKAILPGLSKASTIANVVKDVTPALIKKMALPLAVKSVGKTALKSIPIIGAIAGLGFAVSKLVEGDPVGAGLDLTSGLAGPLTAIPALILSIARDLYTEVYGQHPETDPLVGERMVIVKDGVKQAVEEAIRPAVAAKSSSNVANKKALEIPTQKKIPANDNTKTPITRNQSSQSNPGSFLGNISVTPKSTNPSSATNPQSLISTKSSATNPQSLASTKSSATNPQSLISTKSSATNPQRVNKSSSTNIDSAVDANKVSSSDIIPTENLDMTGSKRDKAITQTPIKEHPVSMANPVHTETKGTDLLSSSERNETLASPRLPKDETSSIPIPTMPARTPTTRPESVGIGNVPDPTYYPMFEFSDQIYFKDAA